MSSSHHLISLGSSGLKVSKLGLGCMGMSEFYGATDDQESIKTIHRAYELGVNHFDTADIYGTFGHNELLLSKVIRSFDRSKIVVATKCGFVKDEHNSLGLRINGTPEHIKKSCDASLKRLGLEYIDLFYLHRADPNTPIEVSMQALADLVKAGKILNIGLCAVSPENISKAYSVHTLAAIQSEYSIITRDAEQDVLPLCKKLNIGFVAYSPTGNGFLSGKIRSVDSLAENDLRRILPRLQAENISHNLGIVQILSDMAITKRCTPVQVALAWILAQSDNITAIPGTKHVKYLEENVEAMNVDLSEDELLQLNNNIPFRFAKGDNLPEGMSKALNNYEIAS